MTSVAAHVSREFPGAVEAAADAEGWVSRAANGLGLAQDAEFAITLCVEELFLNAVKHGHASRATISLWAERDGARLEFVDDGAPFDPSTAAAKRIESPTHDFTIGGYGAGLVQKFSRRISYSRAGGLNRTLLEFDAHRDAGA
jgi:anti-sigma regulatory factor (Ser/Thr protein kinase)